MNFDELTNAISELRGEDILKISNEFINSHPDKSVEEEFMNAVENGIKIVVEKYEMREYTVGDLIYSKEILSQITKMIKPALEEEYTV